MPTLSAMFRILDGYSSQIDKMVTKVDSVSGKVLAASKNTDIYNTSLSRTGEAASKAGGGIGKLIGAVATLATLKQGMDLTDTYTNTNARLSMITDSLEEQMDLQQEIFAAADRSRGKYNEMANAVAKMKMLAGDSFGSNQEAVGFTELLQKSLAVSGASQTEQNAAFLQLTQAMASGRLQGDEFRSIMENAPMVANSIASYMGKSKGELKELSSQGLITSDIIKNAMFAAADDINGKFGQMPMTFGAVWNKISNAGTQAFGGVFKKVNGILNSEGGQQMINNLIGAIYLAGDAMGEFIDFCVTAWPMVSPFIWAAAVAVGAYALALGVSNGLALISAVRTGAQAVSVGILALARWAMTGATWATVTAEMGLTQAQLGANAAMYACPLVWIIGLILVLVAVFYAGVAAINHFRGTTISATGIIGAVIGIMVASVMNKLIFLWNGFADLANFIGNVFNNPAAAVQILFYDMAITVLGYIEKMAIGIEKIINSIPGVTVDITSRLGNLKSGLEKDVKTIKDESGWKEYVKKKEYIDYVDAATKGYNIGTGVEDKVTNLFSGFIPKKQEGEGLENYTPPPYSGFDGIGTGGNPATVKGTGAGGAVKVENEEDIEWMRKLAERDYVARIAQNTLAPNIRVEFNGPITKEADTDNVMARVVEQLKDAIASGPEGVPA